MTYIWTDFLVRSQSLNTVTRIADGRSIWYSLSSYWFLTWADGKGARQKLSFQAVSVCVCV